MYYTYSVQFTIRTVRCICNLQCTTGTIRCTCNLQCTTRTIRYYTWSVQFPTKTVRLKQVSCLITETNVISQKTGENWRPGFKHSFYSVGVGGIKSLNGEREGRGVTGGGNHINFDTYCHLKIISAIFIFQISTHIHTVWHTAD